jgi:acyl-CoA synthetase (AMP-forming)/AMP-acid ligase II
MIFQSSDPEPIYPVVDIYHYFESNPFNVQPGKTIFIDPVTERSVTFGQFQIETKQFAAGLQDSYGFQVKDVLAIFSNNQVCTLPYFPCVTELQAGSFFMTGWTA